MLYRPAVLAATLAGLAPRSHAQTDPLDQARLQPDPPPKTIAGHAVIDGDRASLAALGADLQLHTLEIRGLPFHAGEIQDVDFAAIAQHRRLRSLRITAQPKLTGAGLAALQPLAMLEELALCDLDLADEHLAALRALPALRRLDLSCSRGFGRAGLQEVARLPGLRSLSLRGCVDLNLDDLAAVASITALESLDLRSHPGQPEWFADSREGWLPLPIEIGRDKIAPGRPEPKATSWYERRRNPAPARPAAADAGVRLGSALAELRSLHTLRVSVASVGGAVAATLATLPRLRELEVEGHVLSVGVLAALPRGLRALHVVGGLDDEKCAALAARARDLTTLVIRDSDLLTNAGLTHLTALPALEHLDIAGCPGLATLTLPGVVTQAKHLRFVDLTGVKLLPEQLAAIRSRLPNAQVVCREASLNADLPGSR